MYKKLFPLLLVIAAVCMFPAIYGSLILDDNVHLGPIQNWLATRADTWSLIFDNRSGPIGRPVSILTFVMNMLSTGSRIWPLKLTNLAIHLLTGICLAKLLYHLFKRDSNLAEHAKTASLTAAGLWLILPQHIATVFYVIQRMTLLSTLFAVLSCWIYVVARTRIEDKLQHGKLLLAATIVPIGLSILSKENGLLIPLYLVLIEYLYFTPGQDKPRPALVTWGFRLGVFLPCLIAATFLAFNPGFVLAGYIDRPFSMQERAVTQISVVADYFASTFVPMVRSAGVFNDDFPVSHGFSFHEISLLLIAGILIAFAIRSRKSCPSFSFGIGLFFAGHLLESTILSLEIYFVHRNYLPSIGLVVALWGLVAGLLHRHPPIFAPVKRLLPLAFAGLFLVYAASTYSRAKIWSDSNSLMMQAQIHHPGSMRLRSELLSGALYAKRLDIALQQADLAMPVAPANEKRTVQLWRILAYCYVEQPIPGQELDHLENLQADRITLAASTALGYIGSAAEANACPDLDRKRLGILVNKWAINTVQPANAPSVWKTHMVSARLAAASGDLAAGLEQAQWAFEDSHDFNAGLLAFQLANSLEQKKRVKDILTLLEANKRLYSEQQQSELRTLRNL